MRRIIFLLIALMMVVGLSAQSTQITTSQLRDTAATRQKIKTDAIDSTRIQNGTVSLKDLHSGGASTNQFLKWNGSRWVPAAGSGANYQTIKVDGTAATVRPIANYVTTSSVEVTANDDGGNTETELRFTVPTDGIGDNELASTGITPGFYPTTSGYQISMEVDDDGRIVNIDQVLIPALTSLNGLTGSTQTFATGTSGTNFNISSTGTTHTFNIPDAGSGKRGLITDNSQGIYGDKTFYGQNVFRDVLTLGAPSVATGLLYFNASSSGEGIYLQGHPSTTETYTITLPDGPATPGYTLASVDDGGTLEWTAPTRIDTFSLVSGAIRLSLAGDAQPYKSLSLSGYVATTRAVNTTGSLNGGGSLSIDRTLSLVNDSSFPGNGYFYGTNSSGTKGYWLVSDYAGAGSLQAVTDVGNKTTRSIRSDSLFWVRGTEATLTGMRLTNTTASTGQGWTIQPMNLGALQLTRSGSGNVMTKWSGNDLFQYRNGNFGPVLTTIDAARVVGIDSVSFDISSAIENKSANIAAGAIFVAKTVSGGGNPLLLLQSGSQSYHFGVLNSAADTLYVGPGSTPGTTPSYSIDPSGMLRFKGTGGIVIPSGTTGQRTAVYGTVRWNTSTPGLERYNGSTWDAIGGGSGSSSLSGLTAATASNTIDNLNYQQTWNFSTITSGTSFSMAANALTTGSLLNLTTTNNSLNSSNGLLYIANNGTSESGKVARIQANGNTSGSGLTIMASGKIGVNTSAPDESLHVTGNLKVTGQTYTPVFQLTDGATVAIDWNNGPVQSVTLGGNRTLTFANPKPGTTYKLYLVQDGTGSRTVTWPTIKWPSGVTPTLTTTANRPDIISITYNQLDSSYYGIIAQNFN